MTAPSYRLDVICGNLIERLEGARRTWIDQPDQAREGLSRIAVETVDLVLAERAELMGPGPVSERIRREVLETFLPRYTRLAIDHNQLEDAGYRAWRRGDPIARFVATLVALIGALVLERVVHHPVTLLAFGLVAFVPFIPELRCAWFRRRYRALLQEVVDDMERIQEELDRYPVPLAIETPALYPEVRHAAPLKEPRS